MQCIYNRSVSELMSFVPLLLFVCFCYLGATRPFVLAVLFVAFLLLGRMVVGSVDRFLGLIVFVVYVGGALVLFSYCLILTPLQETLTSFST